MKARMGLLLLAGISIVSIFAPALAPQDPLTLNVPARFQPPGAGHWLGTDEFGRDVLSRLLYGGRVSLLVAGSAVMVAAIVGTACGLVAGFSGGWLDHLALLAADVILAFPGILLALLLVALAGPSLAALVVSISIIYTPIFLRLVRNLTLHLREADFVLACRLLGVRRRIVLFGEIFPNVIAPVAAQAVTCFGWALIAETALSFLGLGAQPPAPSWGSMLASARDYLDFSASNAIVPACAIFLTVWAANRTAQDLQKERVE